MNKDKSLGKKLLPQILAVDDTPDNLKLLTKILSESNFKVRVATSGRLALRSIEAECPDLVLLDVRMPEMDGYEVCKAIKSNSKLEKIPVLFISARDDPSEKLKGFQAGGIDYITKPFEPSEVIARVNSHLNIHFLQKELEEKNILLEREVKERKMAEEALRKYKAHLEEIISERTADLRKINTELKNEILERKKAEEERKRLTEQLHQSQKMEVIGQLAGGVAHDFNNVLTGILGAAEFIYLQRELPDIVRKYLTMILSAGKRAGDMTRQLLAFSRKGQNISDHTDVLNVLNDTINLLGHTINKNIKIRLINKSSETFIIGDKALLQNVFMNLGINASQAMPEGGNLDFILDNIYLDGPYCKASLFNLDPGNYLKIIVQDTGCGIPAEFITRIFEPFFTTKERGKGTGLGLAVVYGIIQNHSGSITVYSEPEKGTAFHIYLPLIEPKTGNVSEYPVSLKGTGTILVVDDEEMIRLTASSLLMYMGYDVVCADNGKNGLDTFIKNRDNINLIILDMIMPVMGGREAFEKIREMDKNVPIIISSGFSREQDLESIKEKGISGFLQKPFSMSELSKLVAEALHK